MRKKFFFPMAALAAVLLTAVLHGQPAARDHLLLVISQTDNTLTAFSVGAKSLTSVATIPIGQGAREVCVAADGRRAYVSNDKDNSVTVVDLGTLEVTATIPLAGLLRPDGCATSPDSNKLYVTALDSESVAVIAADSNRIVATIKVGKEPRRVIFTPDRRRIFVSSEVSDEITIIDPATDKVVDRMKSGGHGPRTMVYLPDHNTMLVTNVDDDTVSFIKTGTKEVDLTIGAGGSPQRIELSRDGASAFVLSVLESKISIIDLKGEHIRAKKFVPVGRGPWGMAMNEDGTLLFVGSSQDNTVTAYDPSSWAIVAKVNVTRPMGIAYR